MTKAVSVAHFNIVPTNVIYGLHTGDRRYRYIGLTTCGIKRRLHQHKLSANREDTRNRPVYCWMRKHGIQNIQIDIIEICNDQSTLSKREIFWISYYRSKGYDLMNSTDGGTGLLTPEGRRKKTVSLRDNTHALGYRHTTDALERIGKASRGNQYARGYTHTEDARSRISKAHSGVPRPYAQRSAHTRWHTKKNVSKPETCKFCKEEINDA